MKRIVTVVLLGFVGLSLVVLAFKSGGKSAGEGKDVSNGSERKQRIVVTYFHNNVRCPSCKKIEAFTAEALQSNFPYALASGALVWRTINTDKPENQHYARDYNLNTKSVVVSKIRDGAEAEWKNLSRV